MKFNPRFAKKNIALIPQCPWLGVSKEGELFPLKPAQFYMKNLLSFGNYRKEIEDAISYSIATLTLEVYNPLTLSLLRKYVAKKEGFFKAWVEKIHTLNGRPFPKERALFHVQHFVQASWMQVRVTEEIMEAVRRERKRGLVEEAREALSKGVSPQVVTRGLSGSYWMRSLTGRRLGLFKPYDEEPFGPNNPVGLQGALGQRRMRRGIRVGESAHREVAAYVVDHYFGFSIVPMTTYASFSHPLFFLSREKKEGIVRPPKTKYGSFQIYLEEFTSLHSLSPKEWKIDEEEFQLLALLDVIIGNLDRNPGNILLDKEGKMAAVDHGLSFSDLDEKLSLGYWELFEGSRKPFLPALQRIIEKFPFEELSELLSKKCFISEGALELMKERVNLVHKHFDEPLINIKRFLID